MNKPIINLPYMWSIVLYYQIFLLLQWKLLHDMKRSDIARKEIKIWNIYNMTLILLYINIITRLQSKYVTLWCDSVGS